MSGSLREGRRVQRKNAAWACGSGRCVVPRALSSQSASAASSSASCGLRLDLPPPVSDLQTTAECVPATSDVLMAVGDAQGSGDHSSREEGLLELGWSVPGCPPQRLGAARKGGTSAGTGDATCSRSGCDRG
jgi:hypothetical protein